MKNKIGWCSMTFNPCWGCRNECPYCYARKIAKRFWKKMYKQEVFHYHKVHNKWAWTGDYLSGLKDFKPTFLEAQFDKKFPQKTQKIFVGSMSEIKYWKKEWVEMVLEKIRQYPQHIFQFLTKFPGVYLWYKFPANCWLGITITDTKDYDYLEYEKFKISNPDNLKFVCFEPLLNEISINLENIDWVILGAESGNRKGKVLPGLDPVLAIFRDCQKKKIPIYVKDNLGRPDVPFDFCRGYKQFPEVK